MHVGVEQVQTSTTTGFEQSERAAQILGTELTQANNARSRMNQELQHLAVNSAARDQELMALLAALRTQDLASINNNVSHVASELPTIVGSLSNLTTSVSRIEESQAALTMIGRSAAISSTSTRTLTFVLERSRSVCPAVCQCKCHSHAPQQFKFQRESFLGSLFVGYCAAPGEDARCDSDDCWNRPRMSLKVAYLFPTWLLNYAVYAFFEHSKTEGPSYGITFRRRTPWSTSDLFQAAYSGDAVGLKRAVRGGLHSPNDVCAENGMTALTYTFSDSGINYETAQVLLRAGADPFIIDDGGSSAYDRAVQEILRSHANAVRTHHIEQIKLLYCIPEAQFDTMGLTVVHNAVLKRTQMRLQDALVNMYTNPGEDIDSVDDTGLSALDWAASLDDVQAVQALLQAGADVNLSLEQPRMRPTIAWAIYSPRSACVSLLIDAGADIHSSNVLENGESPRDKAEMACPECCIGSNALHYAASRSRTEAMKQLLQAGADPDCKNTNVTVTPLIYSARNGGSDAIRLLIEHGAEIDRKDEYGQTALMEAIRYNHAECVTALLDARVDPTTKDVFGNGTLHYAAMYSDEVTMQILRRLGDQHKETTNKAGLSPMALLLQRANISAPLRIAFNMLVSGEIDESSSGDEEYFDASSVAN